jgi:signal transduction histidine kinase
VLRARLERAERLARAGELAAAVAHEVKNPLAAVRGYAELLSDLSQQGPPIDLDRLGKAARIIRESSDRIDERVASLLRLGQAAPLAPALTAVGIDGLVRDAVAVVEEEAREGGIVLALGLPAVVVRAHPDALRGALVNLLRNAIEARIDASPIEVATQRSGTRARVEIADRGPGLDPSLVGRLFEPFQTTKPQGTGLGLSISRSAVEASGGTLALVNRADGPGARAVLEIEIDGGSPAGEA